MQNNSIITLLFCLAVQTGAFWAQTITVKGTVAEAVSGEAMATVTVADSTKTQSIFRR